MWSYDKTCNSEYSDLGTVKCSSQNNHERIKQCSPQVFTVGSSSPNQRKEQLIRQYLYLLSIEFLSSSEHIAFWTTFTSKLMDMNLEEFKNLINQLLYFFFFFSAKLQKHWILQWTSLIFYEWWKDNIKARTAKGILGFSWF